ncbi:MAG: hypothetical protein ACI8RD_009271, partial [Bacillariaceae sp.]
GSQNRTEKKPDLTIPSVRTRQKSSMTIKEEEIDLTGITRNDGTPTLTSITKAKREIGRQLQNKVCADPDSKEHGQSYLIYDDIEWLKKKGVTDVIKPPTNPGTYGGTSRGSNRSPVN